MCVLVKDYIIAIIVVTNKNKVNLLQFLKIILKILCVFVGRNYYE